MTDKLEKFLKSINAKKGPWVQKRMRKLPSVPKKNMPEHRVRRTAPEDSENAVKAEVMTRARMLGILLWRQQAGRVMLGQYHMVLAPSGAADLTGILYDGKRIEVEVKKRKGGKQSEIQKEWQKFIESNGGIYLLVNSGDVFEEKILALGYTRDSGKLPF